MARMFKVTKAHGRVKRTIAPGLRVLVAIPGDEIPIELARECGLIEPEPESAPEPEPEPEPEPKKQSKKPTVTKKLSSYPTKPSR